jgi:hypothetical protein
VFEIHACLACSKLFCQVTIIDVFKLTKNTVGVNNIMLYLLPRDMCDMTVRLQSWSRNVGKLDGASLLCSSGCQFSALKIPAAPSILGIAWLQTNRLSR